MKLIILCFLSLLFATNSLSKPEPAAVRDAAGKIIRAGTYYYIQPVNGGGFEIASISNHHKPCPLDLVQEDTYPGSPLLFSLANSKKGIIRLSTDLNIVYNASYTVCARSNNALKVGPYDRHTGTHFLTLGGVKGNPGRETIDNWFKIEEFGDNYRLTYCPSVCSNCQVFCDGVGIIEYNGQKRLALYSIPIEVKFVKLA